MMLSTFFGPDMNRVLEECDLRRIPWRGRTPSEWARWLADWLMIEYRPREHSEEFARRVLKAFGVARS